MKRLVLTTFVSALCAVSSLAMPTAAELKKAQPLVAELMADDVAAFKAKSKRAEEVADMSVKYAQEASTEAVKFLLLKGAISYYVRGEAYAKAADTVNALRTEIADVPPSVVEEILRKNTARVAEKKSPRLFAQYHIAQVQSAAEKEVGATKVALTKKPKDAALKIRLAEAQALSGDWKSATETFSLSDGRAGAMIRSEVEGCNLLDVADFWWAYKSYVGEDDADLFKMHAVEIYRQCLSDGSIDGLKKNIVEKRLKQVAVESCVVKAPERKPLFNVADEVGQVTVLDVGDKKSVEFVLCPCGEYTMGFHSRRSSLVAHKVRISRPFWIARFPMTYGQQDALMGTVPRRNGEKSNRPFCLDVLGGDDTPAAMSYSQAMLVLGKLNHKHRNALPRGYVFRLATEAEYEYVTKSGRSEYNALSNARGEITQLSERLQALRDKGFDAVDWERYPWRVPYFAVGMKKPNQWGVYDMLTSGWAYVLDTVRCNGECDTEALTPFYQDESVDPLIVDEGVGKTSMCVVRGCGWGYDGKYCNRGWIKFLVEMGTVPHDDCFLRIVVGPDLVSEWRAKHGKK